MIPSSTRPHVKQAAATSAAVCLGFYLGIQYTGRLAYTPSPSPFASAPPAWIGTVQATGHAAIAGFVVAILVAVALEVLDEQEELQET